MKILHVVHAYPPSVGGVQWLVKKISERLVQAYDDQVTVFTTVADSTEYFHNNDAPSLPAGIDEENGVVIRRFPVFNKLKFLRKLFSAIFYRLGLPFNDLMRTLETGPIVFGLTDAVAEHDADVVLATCFPMLHMYNALAGAKKSNTPIVLLGALHITDIWGYDRNMIIKAIQQADAYIALTEYEKTYLVQKGVIAEKIWVIGAGVDIHPISDQEKERYRAQRGLGDHLVIAAVGKHHPRKRFTFLIEAMAEVWRENPNIKVVIAGTGSNYTQILQDHVGSLTADQQKRVLILSDISEAEKMTLLATADIFVHPSIDESFGIVIVEAWANRTPAIYADTAVSRCLIDEHVDGLLFQWDSQEALVRQILALACNVERRESMGEAGYQKVLSQFTWDKVAESVREVYLALHSCKS